MPVGATSFREALRCGAEIFHSLKKLLDKNCLLYTSDAADERSSVDLGGRRIIKKKKKEEQIMTPILAIHIEPTQRRRIVTIRTTMI